jgi:diguanylate cyclase (GGDEF)-like protein/PAS domain S-box-containing protein
MKNVGPELQRPHTQRSLSILFVANNEVLVEHCLQRLEAAQFTASADVVLTSAHCREKLRSQSYDLVIVEYPSASWSDSPGFRLFHQAAQEIPLLLLVTAKRGESVMRPATQGAFDFIEQSHIAWLPGTVRRILHEQTLRVERDEAEKALKLSQSQYHALADNPDYGVLRCDAEGTFLHVNYALVTMLGYVNSDELLAASRSSRVFLDPGLIVPFRNQSHETNHAISAEVQWERKNGTLLRAQVSGGAVYAEDGRLVKYELIVVDLTRQREREDQLRRQALSDPLTGLANRRSLFEALHAEVCRYERTKRDFSFVLMDLDGLKEINDRYGHLVGDRALCRFALVLSDCARALDTLARHGGDEFALVLPETTLASAEVLAQRICTLLAKDAEEPRLSVSAGIAEFPKDANSIPTLIRVADAAMYTMKSRRANSARAARAS